MKTLNNFFGIEKSKFVLTTSELSTVKGGVVPPDGGDSPFTRKKK